MSVYRILPLLLIAILTACSLPQSIPPATATGMLIPTFTPAQPTSAVQPVLTATLTQIPTAAPTLPPAFCQDTRVGALLDSLGSALASANGELLASLISPDQGLDVQFIRSGRVVNYDREHIRFIFESTYPLDWGLGAGSGEPVIGSFKQILLPSLRKVFIPTAQRICNQVKVGGTTYEAAWPSEYAGLQYYSVYFPGTSEYGEMDWQTWLTGVEITADQTSLRALIHFEWEP